MVGVLTGDVAALMGPQGRSSRPDAFAFPAWAATVTAPSTSLLNTENPSLINLNVRVGVKGEQVKVYPC